MCVCDPESGAGCLQSVGGVGLFTGRLITTGHTTEQMSLPPQQQLLPVNLQSGPEPCEYPLATYMAIYIHCEKIHMQARHKLKWIALIQNILNTYFVALSKEEVSLAGEEEQCSFVTL